MEGRLLGAHRRLEAAAPSAHSGSSQRGQRNLQRAGSLLTPLAGPWSLAGPGLQFNQRDGPGRKRALQPEIVAQFRPLLGEAQPALAVQRGNMTCQSIGP